MLNQFRSFKMGQDIEVDTLVYLVGDQLHVSELSYDECAKASYNITFYKKRVQTEKNMMLIGVNGIQSEEEYRKLGGVIGRALDTEGVTSAKFINVDDCHIPNILEGIILGTNYQDTYKQQRKKHVLKEMAFESSLDMGAVYEAVYDKSLATLLARAICNAPLNQFNASQYAEFVVNAFKELNVDVQVLRKDELIEQEFNGLLTVSKGSEVDPSVIVMRYQTNPDLPLTALVGKGITFDMGGYNLKTARDLSGSRVDMGGSAAVFGAIYELAVQQIEANVVGIILTTENLINSQAMVPGDIIKYRNNTTVQVVNTDAEGRLILADGLLYAQELGAKKIIDVATLTGAIGMALGKSMAGLFTDDAELRTLLLKSGDQTGEKLWEFPLVKSYEKSIKSHYADLTNLSTMSFAGHITAALFLKHFVSEDVQWAHLDIAAVVDTDCDEFDCVTGMTGYGVKLLSSLVTKIR